MLFINLYLSKRITKFEIRIAFIKKAKLFCNAFVKIKQTLNFPP